MNPQAQINLEIVRLIHTVKRIGDIGVYAKFGPDCRADGEVHAIVVEVSLCGPRARAREGVGARQQAPLL